jgi:hypothetical protein
MSMGPPIRPCIKNRSNDGQFLRLALARLGDHPTSGLLFKELIQKGGLNIAG